MLEVTTDSGLTDPRRQADFKYEVLAAAVHARHLSSDQLVAGFVDIDGIRTTVGNLIAAFPSHFEHTFAAKANSMSNALTLVRETGLGCEVASAGELRQALQAGFEPGQIVYDEPAKTVASLSFALEQGINFNIDNFQEFDRVRELLSANDTTSRIGFRINPQVGSGEIGAMSTATASSKFGVTLDDPGHRDNLLTAYRNNPWLTSLHTHIGSQGCSIELMVAGIRKIVKLAEAINAATGRDQVQVIDIGGGLSVNFECDTVTPTFAEYADSLQSGVPELFSGAYRVKTEFGRSIFAKNGFIAARVEYTKTAGSKQIAITHAGAQTATRTAFMPDLWAIRIGVADAFGHAKQSATVVQDIAGPCCFAGDMLAYARELPLIEPGDYIILHDTGAYYFSNPFFYNSLPPCAVFGVRRGENGRIEFETWREQQSFDALSGVIG